MKPDKWNISSMWTLKTETKTVDGKGEKTENKILSDSFAENYLEVPMGTHAQI